MVKLTKARAIMLLWPLLTSGVWADTYKPNFENADLQEVIRSVAQVINKNIILDPRVKGQLTIYSPLEVDEQKYYELILRALDQQGFTAVEDVENGIITIMPNRDARASPLPVVGQTNSTLKDNEYVTQVIQLNNVSAARIVPALRQLSPQQQSIMAPIDASNQLLVTDTVANIRKLMGIIEQIDKAAVPGTEVVRLEFADAEELVRTITQLERNSAPANQAAGTTLQIVPDKRTNSVIISGDEVQRQRIKGLIRELDMPQPQSGNVQVIYLQNADAEQVAKVLTNVVQNMAKLNPNDANSAQRQAQATIEADEDTNALIITADIDMLNSLKAVIDWLDIQRAQVLVEAIIVEMKDEVGKNLGIQWVARNDEGGFASSIKPGNDVGTVGQIVQSALDEDRDDALIGIAGALAGVAGQTIGIGRLGNSTDLLALIDLLQAQSGTNILSTPNLLTIDNEEASIKVGESVPFVTGSFTSTGDTGSAQNPFQTISREDVGTKLTVTPHVIAEGNKVLLELVQEISSISAKAGAVDLITNERTITTKVSANDGETIVLGGLIKDNVIQSETRVPLLGSIPILGHLFRSESTSVEKTNLMIFIRPTIIRDDETLSGATAQKYRQIREQQLRQREISSLLIDEDLLPLLPDWDEVQAAREAALKEKQEREAANATNEADTTVPAVAQ